MMDACTRTLEPGLYVPGGQPLAGGPVRRDEFFVSPERRWEGMS